MRFTIPGGQSAQVDLAAALDHIFAHPNVGPFVATRLIRNLVTSNPSPAYISRVATVFNADQNGQFEETWSRLSGPFCWILRP